jgi:hypothetical protein
MPTYSTDIGKMVTRRSFDLLFQTTTVVSNTVTRTGKTTSMTIYSGTQPTAQEIEDSWTSYNQVSAPCLAHYSAGPTWLWNNATLTYYFTNTANTITTNALKSGTASWAIIWDATGININNEDIPNDGRFIVVPVSLNDSTGIIRYTSLTTTIGQPFLPYDGGLTIVEA